jgi:hypothetical protein
VLRKPSSKPIWETPNRPQKKCIVPAFVEDHFERKKGGLRTYKLSFQESVDTIDFCFKPLGTLNSNKTLKTYIKN